MALSCAAVSFDCAILLQNAFEAAWIAWLAGFRIVSVTVATAAASC